MKNWIVVPLEHSSRAGQETANRLRGGEVLALKGPLGSGKTTFTQGLGRALGIKKRMPSPTFTLMNEYSARLTPKGKTVRLYHLDLYRTSGFREAKALGLEEIWGRPDTITVIEWADRIVRKLPKHTWYFSFRHR